MAGLPHTQLDRLQSVLNAAARLVYSSMKYDPITPLLRELHWLRVTERYCLPLSTWSGSALPIAAELHRASDRDTGRRMCSSSTALLIVPQTKHPTIGGPASSLAAVRVWNVLSPTVTSSIIILRVIYITPKNSKRMTSILRYVAEAFTPARQGTILNSHVFIIAFRGVFFCTYVRIAFYIAFLVFLTVHMFVLLI